MSPSKFESERRRALGTTKGWTAAKSVLLAVGGILGAALVVGYFFSEGRTEEIPISKVSDQESAILLDSSDRGSTEWITALESEVHQFVNVERQRNSLSMLSQDPELAEVARAHSEDMALNDYFEHENLAGQTAADRGNAVGYRCLKDFGSFYTLGISENIFQGWYYSSIDALGRNYMTMEELAFRVVDDWMNSPKHRENILTATYDREGIGVGIGAGESVWVTQNFC
jgi:uncharacterized protein YkwD